MKDAMGSAARYGRDRTSGLLDLDSVTANLERMRILASWVQLPA
jgi:hypothetical protein